MMCEVVFQLFHKILSFSQARCEAILIHLIGIPMQKYGLLSNRYLENLEASFQLTIVALGTTKDIRNWRYVKWTWLDGDRERFEFECWSKATRLFGKNDSEEK